ncbi:hypothetical protein CDD82_5546 [Ophiocordyceps australis]|uniref:Uncharacterized protein n=1 Tax=Ophiocordyceps australis TaxID=1399860 RepID=A0A2C5Z1R7_9HYPO|nr:hypothetical protein CDD82_5546 [Ophiocordyceps australis]
MDRVESNDDGQAIISLPGEMNQAPNLCTLATASEAASDLFQPLGQGEAGQEQVVPVQGLGLILYQDDQGANQQLCQHPPSTIYTATSGAGQDEHSPEQQSCAFRLPPIRRSSTINMSSSMGIVKGRKAALKDDGADKSQPASSALETPWDSHAQMAAFDIAPDKAPSSEPIPSTVFPPQGRPRAAGLKRLVKDKQSMPTSRRRLDDEHATQEVLALPVNTVVRARPIVLRGSVPNLAKGPWKLEESHLTKPLQTQTRNRSGTSSSQQPVMTSYEKETGLTTPILAPKPTRPRTSEVLLAVGSDFAEPPSPRMSQDDDFAEPEMTWSGEKRVAGQADDLIQPDELVQKRLEKEQELTSLGDGAFWTAKQANKPCANSPVSQQMENVATANPSMTPRASYHEVQQRAISSSSNSGGSIGHESTSRQGSQKSSPLVSSNARSAAPAPAPEGIANVSRRLDEDAMLPPLNPSLKMEASPKLRGNMSMPGIRDVFRRARHFRHDKSRQLPKGKGKQDAKGATRSPYQSHHADVSAAGQLPSVDVEGYDRRGSTPNILSSLSGTSTSGYGTSDQDGLEGHQQRWLRPQSAGSLPTMLARWSGEHQHGPEAKALHTAPFDEAGVGPSTLGLHRSAAARNPRPSPLGTEEPLTQRNLCPDVIREEPMNDNTAVAHKAKGDHIRHVSEPFPSMAQASHQAVPRTQSLRLAYIGAQHDGEPQRATMSSPHLSVASDRTHGCDLEAGRQDAHAWARPAYGPGGRRYASYQGEPTKRAKPRRRTISHLANTSQSRDEPKEKKKGHHGEGWSKRMSRFELSGLFRGFGKRRISLVEPEVDHGAPQPPAHSFAETPRMNRSLDSVPRPGQVASSGAVKRHSEEHISRWKGLGSRLLGHFSHFASSSQEKVGKHQNNNKSSNKRVEQVAPRTLSGFHGGAVDQRRPHNDDASRRQDGFYARQGRAGHHLQPPTSAAPKHARAVSQSILPTEATGSRSGPFAAPVARTRHSLPLAPMGQSSQAAAAAPRDKRLHAGHVAEFGPVFESVPVPRRYEIVHGEGSLAHAAGGGKVEAACQDEEQATRFGQQDWLRQQQQYQYQYQASQYQKPSVAPQQDSGPMWVQPPLSQPETMTPRTNLLHLADGLPRAGPSSAAAAAGQRPVSHNYHMSKPRSCSYSLADSPGCQSGDESRLSVEAITVSQQSYSPAFDMGQAARRPGAESISRNGSQGSEESKCDTAMPTSAVDTVRCLAQNSSGRDDDDDDDDEHVVGKSPVELDDTADHYQRSRRLEMQEEKILFRPEDSQDWQPPMLATSYPGQEWNPYNE